MQQGREMGELCLAALHAGLFGRGSTGEFGWAWEYSSSLACCAAVVVA